MSQLTTPEAKDWNHYWRLDQTKTFTKISWSKRRIIEIIGPYCQSGKNGLDAGCGSGFFSRFMLEQKMNVLAIDYSQAALDIARKLTDGRVQTMKTDLLSDPLASQLQTRFDFIFTDGLLEHFPLNDQDKILQNLRSVLKDEGVIATFVPNRWSPWELIRPFYMPGIEEKPFTLSELIHLHKRNQFEIISTGGINTLPFAVSPDPLLGKTFGMLLYVIARKK
jgi:SAM-dependent methyltransferase